MNVAAIPVVFLATAAKQEKSNCNCFDRKQLNLHQHNNRENEQLALRYKTCGASRDYNSILYVYQDGININHVRKI